MSAPTAAAADRQLSPPPPHWSLQPPVGPPPSPIDSYRHCHRTGPSSRRWGRRHRRSTAYRRRRAGLSSRRWGRRRRRSAAIATATALVPPAAGGAAADRQLLPLPPHWSLQPPVGPPPSPIDSYHRRRRTGPSSRRRSGIGWFAYLMMALSTLRPVKQLLMSCVMLKAQSLSLPPVKQLLMSCVML
jgi:hypothetical protein